jgi:hypothetical protein
VAARSGTAYVDVGTVEGYRRAMTLLSQRTVPAALPAEDLVAALADGVKPACT